MKITIDKEELLKILKFNEKIVDSKNINNPIFSTINLNINKNQSKCISTNGVISGCYNIDHNNLKIEETGKIVIKNKILLDIISKLKEDKILLHKIENSVLLIKTKNFSSQINIIDNDDFPNINFTINELPKLQIKNKTLTEILKRNGTCTFNDINQIKTISGIYFDTSINNNELTTLSTDTFKLAYCKSKLETNLDIKFILNTTTLQIITQIFKDLNKKINFYIDEVNKKIFIEEDNIIIIDRSISGEFPTEIFIKAFGVEKKTYININKNELINNLELNKVAVNLEQNPTIIFDIKNNKLELNSSSFEIGSTKIEVDNAKIKGDDVKIGFNITFLLSLLKNIESKDVNLYIENNLKPMLLIGEDENFKELLLPIRLNN